MIIEPNRTLRISKQSESNIYTQIAVDGPAASGKSTVSRLTARKIGGLYVNTGDLYRALTWLALRKSLHPESDPEGITELLSEHKLSFRRTNGDRTYELCLFIDGTPVDRVGVRSPEVTEKVSFVARIPRVRERMIDLQRNVKSLGLIVMEGRDIGTVIFPGARHKFFITATPQERARRRLQQSREVSDETTLQSLTAKIRKRDLLDSNRKVAPLKPASDALVIDTTDLSIDQVVARMLAVIALD